MAHYFKAVRPNGTDFWSGTIDYAAALATGEPIHHPDPRPGSRDATHYLSVATEVTECTGMRWPCRVYVVEPDGETWAPSSGLPHKVACTSVRVVEEVAATLALGPQSGEITALIERCTRITVTDMEKLAAARAAARDAARAAAWAAARDTAWDAAWDAAWAAAWDAARAAAWDAAWAAAWEAAWAAAWDAARAAAWAAARAAAGLLVRDLIGQHGLTQGHYDLLTQVWRTAIGPIHPDDAPIAGDPA